MTTEKPELSARFEGLTYPVKVVYCGECSLPTEYCSYFGDYEKCKAWLEKNLPDKFEALDIEDKSDGEGGDGKSYRDEKSAMRKRLADLYLLCYRCG